MTLREFVDAINLQGDFLLRVWNEEKEDYTAVVSLNPFIVHRFADFPVTFIYPDVRHRAIVVECVEQMDVEGGEQK